MGFGSGRVYLSTCTLSERLGGVAFFFIFARSVTFDPWMYLSLPIPFVDEQTYQVGRGE